jgi:hypothetical protein
MSYALISSSIDASTRMSSYDNTYSTPLGSPTISTLFCVLSFSSLFYTSHLTWSLHPVLGFTNGHFIFYVLKRILLLSICNLCSYNSIPNFNRFSYSVSTSDLAYFPVSDFIFSYSLLNTSQKLHLYLLHKIRNFHGSENVDCGLKGCDAV